MKNRSSFHFVTGDGRPSKIARNIYRASYRLESLMAALRSSALPIAIYEPTFDRAAFVKAFGEKALDSSASRTLCYDFILNRGDAFFGPERSIIDLGCGVGNYAGHFRRAFGYRRYVGYDVSRRDVWPELQTDDTRFETRTLGVDSIDVSGYDTVFSQSVLEHVANDAAVFWRFTTQEPRRLRHMHLIPAWKSFEAYRYHGFRRYAPHHLDVLTSAPGIEGVQAYALGNALTRAMYRDHYGYLKGRHQPADFESPYDATMTMFDNLVAQRDKIRPQDPKDADFYVLTFDQVVS